LEVFKLLTLEEVIGTARVNKQFYEPFFERKYKNLASSRLEFF